MQGGSLVLGGLHMTSSHSNCACVAPRARGDRRCAVCLGHSGSPIHVKSRRCQLGHVISCVQSQLITCKQGNACFRHFS
ncbi:unnamed protein product, partial [Staurois parvus]